MSKNTNLKYDCIKSDQIENILHKFKDQECLNYIKELWNLIEYQKTVIKDERKQLIALKHSKDWQHYDRYENTYHSNVRKPLDKPDKTDTMGC
jgi:flagellar biosynthesis chaperone FliJ